MNESLHKVGMRVKDFVLNSDLVDDVFASDDEIIEFSVSKMRLFKRS